MCRKSVNLLVLVSIICAFSSSAIGTPPANYTKVWEDTFSSFDTANWTIGLRDPGTGDLVPGAQGTYRLNNNHDCYITADDVWVSGGSLYLQNQQRSYTGTDPAGTYDYTTGWVMSMHKVYFNKGYIEMRAQLPSGDKVRPAYWLIAEDIVWGPEWDIFEYFGWRSDVGYDKFGMHLCYDEWPDEKWKSYWISDYCATYTCEAWHTYGFEWTGSWAKWYIDDTEVRHLDNTIGSSWPNEDMYIMLHNSVGLHDDTNTTWPNYLVVDYIEIHEWSGGSYCGDGTCDPGEDCITCSNDCISKTGGPPSERYCCGDGTCEGEENEENCAIDCGGGSYCGDGTCDPGEDQCNCSDDCGTPPSNETSCDDGIDNDCDTYTDCDDSDCDGDPACPYCGDETCDPGEDQCNCPEDCGTPPSTETSCTDEVDNDCDTYVDCDDADCVDDPACQSTCDNDGTCEPGEDCNNCPNDCEGRSTGRPSGRFCCGNGIAEDAEGDGSICDGNY